MSESKAKGNAERRADRARTSPPEASAPGFTVAAAGENVVLVNVHTGQSWVMATDNGRPVWHPVAFQAGAARAPRRVERPQTSE